MKVNTETNGRYTEIYIDGVEDGSIAYDEKENELIVNGDARPRDNGVVVELPKE